MEDGEVTAFLCVFCCKKEEEGDGWVESGLLDESSDRVRG